MTHAPISQCCGLRAASWEICMDKMNITVLLVLRLGYSDQEVMVSFR
jgi:hypothetical protein